MTDIQAVIFDKDGTLFDFHSSWADWARIFIYELAEGVPEKARAIGGAVGFDVDTVRFASDSPAIFQTNDEIAELVMPHVSWLTKPELEDRMNRAAAVAEMQPAVPLTPLLDVLAARGLRFAVVTNDAEASARAHLTAAGILDRFDHVFGYDSGVGAKPDPAPILHCAAVLGVAPAACLMVGDSRHDLSAGRGAGAGTVGVLTGAARASDLDDLADVILPDIGGLPDYLTRLAARRTG